MNKWYRVELKRHEKSMGHYQGEDIEQAVWFIRKWTEVVKEQEHHGFKVKIHTNDTAFQERLNTLV